MVNKIRRNEERGNENKCKQLRLSNSCLRSVVGGFCPFGTDRYNSLQTVTESRLFCVIVCLETDFKLTCDGRTCCHGNGAREKDDAYW
jgi:hypothetical protein